MSIFRCFEQFSSTMKTPKQTYHSRSLQEKAKIIEDHLKGVSKAKLMENYKIPKSTLNKILQRFNILSKKNWLIYKESLDN